MLADLLVREEGLPLPVSAPHPDLGPPHPLKEDAGALVVDADRHEPALKATRLVVDEAGLGEVGELGRGA